MKCTALWFGGCNYALPDPGRDLERFGSIVSAVRAFEARLHDPYYPCVENPQMWIFFGDDTGYPDRIVHLGARGAVIVERA